MAKNLEIAVLLDFYGELLTEKRREFVNYYYNEDLSLSEIAENEGLSRQGVRDTIKRGEEQLFFFESQLHMAEKFRTVSEKTHRLFALASRIEEENRESGAPIAEEIRNIAAELQNLG